MIPADIRIIDSKDLFISQASLTGESEPIEKFPEVQGQQFRKGSVIELDNICYMGSNVISGAAKGIVLKRETKPIWVRLLKVWSGIVLLQLLIKALVRLAFY